jgi:flagellar motor switch/type III secretory pathway protein FliN
MVPTTLTETAPSNAQTAPAGPSVFADPWAGFLHIPLLISIDAPIAGLTVRELFRLERGSIVATSQSTDANVPVRAGGALIGWGEFQVLGEKLALRLAELA